MDAALLLPAAEAAVFTLGCAVIHTQRRHAGYLTVLFALLLFGLVGLLAVVARSDGMPLADMAAGMAEIAPLAR